MSYCINPLCAHRQNPDNVETCLACGTTLLINNRIRLIKPLRPLTDDPYSYFEVFEIEDFGTQWNPVRKQRVMKVLKWNSSKLRELIERESITLRRIRHQNIPKSSIDDFFTFVPNNSPLKLCCLVMDKIEGQNLDQWLEFNEPISQLLALEWLQELVKILDVVHHTGFFHRDIKPSNIIIKPDGQLVLIDFGTARRVSNTYLVKVSGSGGTSVRVGTYEITSVVTACYTPPEQMNGKAVPQSDFYALGRTFVNLVTGISLIDLPTNEKTGNLVWRDKAPQIDKPFADFIDELMAPLPGQRPQTTEVILQRLEKLPQQIKNYRLANSQIFIFSRYVLIGLVFFGGVFLSKPLAANYLVTQGQKLEAANNYRGAQYFFNWAIKIRPQSNRTISSFYFDKAVRSTKDLGLAKKYYELATKYNNYDADAYTNLAFICQQLNEDECAIKNYESSFKLKPDNWESRFGLALFYDDRRMYNLAEKHYKLAIEMSREAIPAINNLSRLKILDGEYNVAIALAKSGLQKTENIKLQSTLYKNLGWAKLELKRYAEAKADLEKSTKLDARTDAYCLLAQAQEGLGEINDARLTWEICLIAESNQLEVQQWRLQILKRLLGEFVTPSSP
ncbi:protein kinase [uncultured Nostoc sp.]|uniref:protein kinase domain-containing protein n=1 Tax=uncultured Nostoc sp. TaxID=340711 RepID=UPI0035CB6760